MTTPLEAEIAAFLAAPASYAPRRDRVEVIETHAARIFLAGDEAIKVKKHVRLPYLDFSTLEQRHAACARELELNRPAAPDIYLGLVAITRGRDGKLAFAGDGETVDVAVRMRRFDQADVMTHVAEQGRIDSPMAKAMADVVCLAHDAATVARTGDGIEHFADIIADVEAACGELADEAIRAARSRFARAASEHLSRLGPVIARRAAEGFRRRCHGDLHLGNMVLWRGKPIPFDALEFDEEMATIDVLYDLAFLLMDLERFGLRAPANVVLNRYLWRTDARNLSGLATLPLFMALRAGIRAMVEVHRGRGSDAPSPEIGAHVHGYLDTANALLTPVSPCLIAVGGLSGSGKSTLAAALAPSIGIAPGSVHLRSDLERKRLFAAGETDRLPDEAYARGVTEKIYATLSAKAAAVIASGYTVVVDAVHAAPDERDAIELVARAAGVPFVGIWLDAPQEELVRRVEARRGDASDATAAVVEHQMGYDLGNIAWHRLDAGGNFDATRARAAALVAAAVPHML